MRSAGLRLLLVGGVLVAVAGCATGEEWATWKSHPTHFASGEHMRRTFLRHLRIAPADYRRRFQAQPARKVS